MKVRWMPLLLLLLCVSAGGSVEGNGLSGEDETSQNETLKYDRAKDLRSFEVKSGIEQLFNLSTSCLTGIDGDFDVVSSTTKFWISKSPSNVAYYAAVQSCNLDENAGKIESSFGHCPTLALVNMKYLYHMCAINKGTTLTCCCPNIHCQKILLDMSYINLFPRVLISSATHQEGTYAAPSNACLDATWKYKTTQAMADSSSMWTKRSRANHSTTVCRVNEVCGIRTFYKELKFEFGCFPVIRSTLASDILSQRFSTVNFEHANVNDKTTERVYKPVLKSIKKKIYHRGKLEVVDELGCFGDNCNTYIFVNFLLPIISKDPEQFQSDGEGESKPPEIEPPAFDNVPLVERKFNEIYTVEYKDYMWFRENCGPYLALFLGVYFLFIYWLSFKCDPEVRRGIQQAHREFARLQAMQMQAKESFSE